MQINTPTTWLKAVFNLLFLCQASAKVQLDPYNLTSLHVITIPLLYSPIVINTTTNYENKLYFFLAPL